jgi:magnesium transporter
MMAVDDAWPRVMKSRPAPVPDRLHAQGGIVPTEVRAYHFEGPRVNELVLGPEQTAIPRHRDDCGLWVRISGLGHPAQIEALLESLAVPADLIDRLSRVPHVPLVESMHGGLVVILQQMASPRSSQTMVSQQVSFLLMQNLLITIEETPEMSPWLSNIDFLRSNSNIEESFDLSNLLHEMVDEVLDGLFPVLELIAHRIDGLEELALREPKPHLLNKVIQCRTDLRQIRGISWPLSHQIRSVLRRNHAGLCMEALGGFRDMEETVHLIFEQCELLRHQCDAITDTYAASVGNRMNQIMKTLTIISSIFAPLTFIAGVYGMNFDNMPELHWGYGYFTALMVMGAVALAQTVLLWKRGWFQDWTGSRR